MKLKPTLTIFLFSACLMLYGQNLPDLMDQNLKYEEICDILNAKFAGKSTIKGHPNYASGYKQYLRWSYFWENRLMPDGDFPSPKVILDAWSQKKSNSNHRLESIQTANWTYFGPKGLPTSTNINYPGMGRVNAIAVHPTQHNTIFVGAANAGIWKTTDKGATWTSKTDQLPHVGISDIVFDPNNPNTLYATTGDADNQRTPYSTGLLKSTDLGETWKIVGRSLKWIDKVHLRKILMPKSQANTLILTASNGIHKSTDGGVTSTNVSNEKGYSIIQTTDNIYYAGTSDGKVIRSEDGGNTWEDTSPETQVAKLEGRVELAGTPQDPNYIVGFDRKGTVIKSTDDGENWTKMTTPPQLNTQSAYNMAIGIAPSNKNRIIIGGVHGWRSNDGGTSWEKYMDGYWETNKPFFYVHSDHHVMRFHPDGSDVMFVGHDGGVHYGDLSKGTKFTDISKGLNITQYYGIGLYPKDATTLLAGAQDNDAMYATKGTFKGVLPTVDGIDGVIDYSNPSISYMMANNLSAFEKTTDGWKTSENLETPTNFKAPFVPSIVMHPTVPTTLFLGGAKSKKKGKSTVENGGMLLKSVDGGDSWQAIFTEATDQEFVTISKLAVAPSSGDIIVFFTNDGLLKRTTNGGTNWNNMSDLPSDQLVSGIAIHPTNPDIIYVTVGSFDAGKKVYQTTDAGQSWTNISTGIPNIPVKDIVIRTGKEDELYLATDLGVYVKPSKDKNWELYSTNLPNTIVSELEIHYETKSLFAATFGRGIWKSPLLGEKIDTPTGLSIDSEQSKVLAYPSPTNGKFTLEIKEDVHLPFRVLIYNTAGGVVYNKLHATSTVSVDISNEAKGMYFVSIDNQKGQLTQKIILSDD